MSPLQGTLQRMGARRSYTDAQRAEALALYAEAGAADAARQTGISAATIRSWASRTGAAAALQHNREANVQALRAKWAERRAVMIDEIGAVAHMALAGTSRELEGGHARNAKDLATTMAILVDKAQLLSGAATARQEHVVDRTPEVEGELARVLELRRAS